MNEKNPAASFDINDPELPKHIDDTALSSGGYPYKDKLKREVYEDHLHDLQVELIKLQTHLIESKERIVIVFEGRDAAGKGGTIKRYTANINPRNYRIVALPKPSDREQTQWYFQRYVTHMPAAGETVLFDRSWYNRAVVEPVMGFCTLEESALFLNQVPRFEQMLVEDGIHLFKFWLDIGQEMQLKRFHDRRHDPLKTWKLSPIDLRALDHWDDYTLARDTMLKTTHTQYAPWTVIRLNDKRRGRIGAIQTVLSSLKYAGKNEKAIGDIDSNIVRDAWTFLKDR